MNELGTLLCGGAHAPGMAKAALEQLQRSVVSFSARAAKFFAEPVSDDTLALGPFCARVVLENACAALVGRIDSFRMLYLAEFQAQPEYKPGSRARSGFSWTGDVIPDERAAQALWSLDTELPRISRALFSKHIDHIYWKPAVESMLDFVSNNSEPLLGDVRLIDADSYIDSAKGRSQQLYSSLSKAVHWEFFTTALVFDEATVKSLIRDTFILVGHLGLVSHFIPTAYAPLQPTDAVDCYISIRKAIP